MIYWKAIRELPLAWRFDYVSSRGFHGCGKCSIFVLSVLWFVLLTMLSVNMCIGDDNKTYQHGDMWLYSYLPGRNPKPPRIAWSDAIGKRVMADGIAWGSVEKSYGEYLIFRRGEVFVDKAEFLEKKMYGRMVRVSGILRKKEVGSNRLNIFIIEDATITEIKNIEWPYLREEEDAIAPVADQK